MKREDLILLEKAYTEILDEGIWDRLKGQAAGIAAGAKAGVRNAAIGLANKMGASVPQGKGMGASYANAQQKSIFNSFVQKINSEIQEFEDDMVKLGKQDVDALKASHPEIEQLINNYKGISNYIANLQTHMNAIR